MTPWFSRALLHRFANQIGPNVVNATLGKPPYIGVRRGRSGIAEWNHLGFTERPLTISNRTGPQLLPSLSPELTEFFILAPSYSRQIAET